MSKSAKKYQNINTHLNCILKLTKSSGIVDFIYVEWLMVFENRLKNILRNKKEQF